VACLLESAAAAGGYFLDDDAAEDHYQLAAPEGITAEKVFDARWAAALVEAAFARLRGELESEGKGHLF
jgi:hypothetical protein